MKPSQMENLLINQVTGYNNSFSLSLSVSRSLLHTLTRHAHANTLTTIHQNETETRLVCKSDCCLGVYTACIQSHSQHIHIDELREHWRAAPAVTV